jgi:hypothetical protein
MIGRASAPTKSLKRAPIAVSSPSSPSDMFSSATPATHPFATGPNLSPPPSARRLVRARAAARREGGGVRGRGGAPPPHEV